MSADFWAGYISGAAGIIIGNPLDILKVRLQVGRSPSSPSPIANPATSTTFPSPHSLIRGASAPILGYGALNALLFLTYNRTRTLLHPNPNPNSASVVPPNLWTTWLAGAIGGLATWVVSTPTELIKCRAQLSSPSSPPSSLSSWSIAKQIFLTEGGIRGLYLGGAVTAWRDSIGYGFYFWSYEASTRYLASSSAGWLRSAAGRGGGEGGDVGGRMEAARVLLCGGLAGVVTWMSVFPLDVVKTRVQMQVCQSQVQPQSHSQSATHTHPNPHTPLLLPANPNPHPPKRLGALQIAHEAYATSGPRVFFRGLAVCSVRAFVVNAVQWAVYEWVMRELDAGRAVRGEE